ncbi:MAG: DEAD/DEAH box helicase [Pseudonocardiaceae bacterium]|nr:MAG: DEAD/DEAH box helicase [Pseudonocardiaceae bacterium]
MAVDARTTVAAARDLARRATTLLGRADELRAQARHQLDGLKAEEVGRRLKATPVSTLREAAGRGVRWTAIEQAGLRTVADVLDSRRLLAVPGVGERTAQQVTQAARTTVAAVRTDVRFRFDADRRGRDETDLLATLAGLKAADAAQVLAPHLRQLLDITEPLADEAELLGSWWKRTFSGRRRRDSARDAHAQLAAILAEPSTQAVVVGIGEHEGRVRSRDRRPADLWADYTRDAAAVNALLSTIGAADDVDEASSQGFVRDELRQRVVAVPLDTSLLTPGTTLRGYQVFGAQYALHQQRSMLGDEMGLGKTLQALATLCHLAANGQRRFLVICPASVLVNWLKETERYTQLGTHTLHGPDREAAGSRWLRDGGVAVTTFSTLGRLPEEVRVAEIAMLVVDEAHFVKNPAAERTKAVVAVASRAQRALFLTGTPMENRVEEFRALVGHLQPRVARRVDARDALGGAKAFRRAVADVYLRRNQDDVLKELPQRIETEAWVQLGNDDMTRYRAAVTAGKVMAMRRAALESTSSAKLERIREIVEEAAEDGMKVLIFTTFLPVLTLLAQELPGVIGRIDGSVSTTARQDLVDAFSARSGHAVLLSQIEAGGVGLNIQAASVVILAEPHWKPSVEEQAIARAHRMGQIRPVQVHRILAKDSIDERIVEIQQDKTLLFDAFARRSEAKERDARAVDSADYRPAGLDDATASAERRVLIAERHRLGMG